MNKTRKILCILLVMLFCSATASCGKTDESDKNTTASSASTTATTSAADIYSKNPLTGIYDLDKNMAGKRPVAVMINNINVAKPVQTGVGKADMIFETFVEGGITRLMAVYSDISKINRIGTVRSARYSYVELVCGLDARYVHCGSDNKYATPLFSSLDIDHLDLDRNASSAGERVSNGLAIEHTLYALGKKIYKIYKEGRTDIKERAENVYSFNDESAPVKYKKKATDISVYFSGSYKTTFDYDNKSRRYIRGDSYNEQLTDCYSGKKEYFKNVLILYTSVTAFSDGHHMKSHLDSGSGVYITQGTQTKIKWGKGDATQPLLFYNEKGEKLKLNAGNSYICITSTSAQGLTTIS